MASGWLRLKLGVEANGRMMKRHNSKADQTPQQDSQEFLKRWFPPRVHHAITVGHGKINARPVLFFIPSVGRAKNASSMWLANRIHSRSFPLLFRWLRGWLEGRSPPGCTASRKALTCRRNLPDTARPICWRQQNGCGSILGDTRILPLCAGSGRPRAEAPSYALVTNAAAWLRPAGLSPAVFCFLQPFSIRLAKTSRSPCHTSDLPASTDSR